MSNNFEFQPKSRQLSETELLDDLKQVFKDSGLSPSARNYKEYGGMYYPQMFRNRFESWNNALQLAGLEIARVWRIEDEIMFSSIFDVWQRLGSQPSRNEYNQNKLQDAVSSSALASRFGSWNGALKAFCDWANSNDLEDQSDTIASKSSSKRTPRSPNLRLKWRVLHRDNFRCQACGGSPAKNSNVELRVDHIFPWAKGGETEFENLQVLCNDCNSGKSDLV